MSLSKADVARIAELARLALGPAEFDTLAGDLEDILSFVEQMGRADTAALAPLAHPLELDARLREDAVSEPNRREALLACAPLVEDGLYLVPRVIE